MNNIDQTKDEQEKSEDLGKRLASFRESKGFNKINEYCREIGIESSTYRTNETGASRIPAVRVIRIADHFNCSVDEVLGRVIERNSLSSQESEVVDLFRRLNDEGKQEILNELNKELENSRARRFYDIFLNAESDKQGIVRLALSLKDSNFEEDK